MKTKTILLSFLFVLFLSFTPSLHTEAANQIVETGSSITLTDYNLTNGTGYTKTWSSSNTSIASTSSNGTSCTVYGRRSGTVTITCYTRSWVTIPYYQITGPYVSDGYWTTRTTYDYITRYYTVEVVNSVQSVNFSNASLNMNISDRASLTLRIVPSDARVFSVRFSSSNPNIASVNDQGEILSKKQGTTTITAIVNNKHIASCTINVQSTPANATNSKNKSSSKKSVSSDSGQLLLNTEKIILQRGEKFQLQTTLDGKPVVPSYINNNKKIISINKKGKIIAKAYGKAKIKVKINDNKAVFCTVKVVPKKISGFKASVKRRKIIFRWNKASNVSGYRIYKASKVNGKYKLVKTVSSSKRKTTLKNTQKESYYKICAFKTIKGKTYKGAYSTILFR